LLLAWVWTQAAGDEAGNGESCFDEIHGGSLMGT
jgi:hypothetical protein